MTILNTIVEAKRRELEEAGKHFIRKPVRFSVRRGPRFSEALRGRERVSLIAEVKKASPSEGVICEDFDPVALARAYERAGASAISVLTDESFFQGSLEDLRQVAQVVSLPVLRKDFILDEGQIYDAAQAGASAVLLIAAILDDKALRGLRELAESLGMEALVEVHDDTELERALASGATIIGINNRDLKTFNVNLNITLDLGDRIPEDVVVVSESGITDHRDRQRLEGRVDAMLVGTSLMRCPDVELKIHELFMNRPLVKVCGVQDEATVRFCQEIGVDFMGFNFVKESARYLSPSRASFIKNSLTPKKGEDGFRPRFVGLFCNASPEYVNEVALDLELDFIQLHGDENADYCARMNRPVIKSFLPGQPLFKGVLPLYDLGKGHEGVVSLAFKPEGIYGVAGGLTPDNVTSVIKEHRSFFVDVARGVETDGVKDYTKIQSFLNQLRSC